MRYELFSGALILAFVGWAFVSSGIHLDGCKRWENNVVGPAGFMCWIVAAALVVYSLSGNL